MIEPQPDMTPRDLIRCDPDAIERLAARLARFGHSAADAAGRLARLDSEHWSGPAAERFRAAVSDVPDQMHRAAAAFDGAARELVGYAAVVRAGLRTADRAIGLAGEAFAATAAWRTAGSPGPDPGEPTRQQARRLAELAVDDVRRAAVAAAHRLGDAAARAPGAVAGLLPGNLPGVRAGNTQISAVVDHELADPDRYLAPLDQLTGEVRFEAEHHVDFAGGGGDWESWLAAGDGRSTGTVSAGVVAGAALLLGGAGRRRTALESAGLQADDLRRRPRQPRGGDGGAGRAGRGWRTNLAGRSHSGDPIRTWVGLPGRDPPRRAAAPGTLSLAGQQTLGAVLHVGPPMAGGDPRSRPATDAEPG